MLAIFGDITITAQRLVNCVVGNSSLLTHINHKKFKYFYRLKNEYFFNQITLNHEHANTTEASTTPTSTISTSTSTATTSTSTTIISTTTSPTPQGII